MINFRRYLTIKYWKVGIHGYYKMKRGLLIAAILFNLIPEGLAQNSKRALSLLEKKDYLKVEQIFRKSIEKDSINPGSYYVYSQLFLSDSFPRNNLDSSYILILKAIDHYALVDQKEIDRLNKIQINDSTLWAQKNKIDSLAYKLARKSNDESKYNMFLEKHPTATQVNQVKTLRNKVAYLEAKRINTYQSYKNFMDKYPDASEIKEANDNYNQLLFAEKTKERSLSSYQHFLVQHPQTPFREIIEKDIFEITTANNKSESFEKFIHQYPKSKYAKKALDYLYYHQQENGKTPEDFLKKYKASPNIDSIRKIIPYHEPVLFPVFENHQYKFIDQTGKLVEGLALDQAIAESYYCLGVEKDFIITGDKINKSILTKSGEKIYEGLFENAKALGYGLLKFSRGENYGIVHRSGWEVFPVVWDEVTLISDQFLVVEKKRTLGLATLSGRMIFTPQFQDIQSEGNFFIFKKEGKIAITIENNLAAILASNKPQLQFFYDDYQPVSKHLMIAIRKGQECLINDKLETVIPLHHQKIYDQPLGWYVIKADTFLVYDHQFKQVFASRCDQYQFKDKWFGLKQNGKWALHNPGQRIKTDFEFDSIQFLSKNAVCLIKDDERSVLLSNSTVIQIKENQNFQLILSNFQENKSDSLEYLIVTDPKKRLTTLYNLKGDKIKVLTNTQVNALYDGHFIIEKNGKKGIMNSKGKVILSTYYDAIGKPKKGVYSLLQRNKFGLFGVKEEFTIRPEYGSALSIYNQSLLVASKSDKMGFINHDNKKLGAFVFEKIRYWSDSLAVVNQEGKWGVYDIYKQEFIIDNLTGFQIFADSSEKKAIVRGEKGYGVISNQSGIVINPTFDDLRVIGNKEAYLYFCEKHVREASLYVVVYYDQKGKMIRRQVYDEEEYDKIYCDN